MCAPSQWEITLQCNVISHWLGAYIKWSMYTRKRGHMAHLKSHCEVIFFQCSILWPSSDIEKQRGVQKIHQSICRIPEIKGIYISGITILCCKFKIQASHTCKVMLVHFARASPLYTLHVPCLGWLGWCSACGSKTYMRNNWVLYICLMAVVQVQHMPFSQW